MLNPKYITDQDVIDLIKEGHGKITIIKLIRSVEMSTLADSKEFIERVEITHFPPGTRTPLSVNNGPGTDAPVYKRVSMYGKSNPGNSTNSESQLSNLNGDLIDYKKSSVTDFDHGKTIFRMMMKMNDEERRGFKEAAEDYAKTRNYLKSFPKLFEDNDEDNPLFEVQV